MSYTLVVTEPAQLQAEIAKDQYEEKQIGLGDRFRSELSIVYKKISSNPQHYSFVSAKYDLRDVKLQRFPYVVVYRIVGNHIHIVSVRSTHQEPKELG